MTIISRFKNSYKEKKEKEIIKELLLSAKKNENPNATDYPEETRFAVFLSEVQHPSIKKSVAAFYYLAILSAFRSRSKYIFLPSAERFTAQQKINKEHWREFFLFLCQFYRVYCFIPYQENPIKGEWYSPNGSVGSVDIEKNGDDPICTRIDEKNDVNQLFCHLNILKNPEKLREAKNKKVRILTIYTSGISRETEVFAGGRGLQYDLFVLVISPGKIYLTGPSIWGADKPYFHREFIRKTASELFSFHIPFQLPVINLYERYDENLDLEVPN
jgi:hypothetical protein